MKTMDRHEREAYEVAEINRAMYEEDIAGQAQEYRKSIKDFTKWITADGFKDEFEEQIHFLNKRSNEGWEVTEFWGVAVEYSIPVIMVKHFMRAEA